jgi:hypothetical protein
MATPTTGAKWKMITWSEAVCSGEVQRGGVVERSGVEGIAARQPH